MRGRSACDSRVTLSNSASYVRLYSGSVRFVYIFILYFYKSILYRFILYIFSYFVF